MIVLAIYNQFHFHFHFLDWSVKAGEDSHHLGWKMGIVSMLASAQFLLVIVTKNSRSTFIAGTQSNLHLGDFGFGTCKLVKWRLINALTKSVFTFYMHCLWLDSTNSVWRHLTRLWMLTSYQRPSLLPSLFESLYWIFHYSILVRGPHLSCVVCHS